MIARGRFVLVISFHVSITPIAGLVRRRNAVLARVVVAMVVDRVAELERRWHNAEEETNPPVENITKDEVLIVPATRWWSEPLA